jgi:hypothetical protein
MLNMCMALKKFRDWLDESSAFTRRRRDAALGLAPPIPDASMHSRSTASPFEVEQSKKGKKKKRKKKDSGKNPINSGIDAFVKEAEALKKDKETSDRTPKIVKKSSKPGKRRCASKKRT